MGENGGMRPVLIALSIALAGSAMTAAQVATQDPALHLSKSLQDAASHYASDTDAMRNAASGGAICGVLQESKELGAALSRTLDRRRDAIAASDLDLFAVTGTSGAAAANTAKQKDAFDAAVRALSDALPGVFEAEGEAVRFGPDYGALGALARSVPEKRLLQASGTLLAAGSPLTFAPPIAARCTDLTATVTAAEIIVKSWPAAPKCLQDAIANDLNSRIGELSAARYSGVAGASFCESKEQTAVPGARLAELIATHVYLGGSPGADFLREALAAPDTKFSEAIRGR